MRISLVLFLTITFSNVFAKAAGCVDEAISESNIDPSVTYKVISTPPDENGNVKTLVIFEGIVYGSLTVLCDSDKNFVKILEPYEDKN